jgi:hypothetical protein
LAGIVGELAAARRPQESTPSEARDGPPPAWIYPSRGGAYGYDDAGGKFWLEWSGAAGARYVLQYQVGTAPLDIAGEITVTGRRKDFGRIERRYWDTWIVPYSPFRVRVGYDGPDPRWSEWLDLSAE